MFIIPAAALVVLAAITVFLVLRNVSPMLTVSRALNNLYSEAAERIDSTPLKAAGIFQDVIADGSVSASFTYNGALLNEPASGNVKILSDTKERDFALFAELTILGQNIDFEAYLNRERLAARSTLFDDSFYGLTYSSFRDDIRPFGRLIRLSDETMDRMADSIDLLSEAFNREAPEDDSGFEMYHALFTNFISNSEMTSRNVRIESGGRDVRCKKISITITEDALFGLLNDSYRLLENDETIRSHFYYFDDPVLFGNSLGEIGYDSLLRSYREAISEFESSYSGDFTISFYIGRDDRLLRLEIDADIRYDDDILIMNSKSDFGGSALDLWTLDISTTENQGQSDVLIVWDYWEHSGFLENRVTITTDGQDQFVLISSWSPDSGDFRLSFIDSDSDSKELAGKFAAHSDGFILTFDNLFPLYSGQSFALTIIAEKGADIGNITFIGPDQWIAALTRRLGSMIAGYGGDILDYLFRDLITNILPF